MNDGHVQLSGKMVGSEDVRASCKIGLNFATSKMCKSGSQFEACTMTEVAYSHLSSGPTSSSYTRKIHFVHSSKRSTHEVLLTQILNLGLYRIFFFLFAFFVPQSFSDSVREIFDVVTANHACATHVKLPISLHNVSALKSGRLMMPLDKQYMGRSYRDPVQILPWQIV